MATRIPCVDGKNHDWGPPCRCPNPPTKQLCYRGCGNYNLDVHQERDDTLGTKARHLLTKRHTTWSERNSDGLCPDRPRK